MTYEHPKRDKETLNMEEAAKFLGIGVCTLRDACRNEKNAPPFRRIGRRYLFSSSGLREWLVNGGATQG